MYANISFEQLGEITMPKAVDCLSRNVEATSYQMSCKSKHGSAHLRVEKTSWRATTRKDKVGKCCKQRQDKKVPAQGWTGANSEFIISSWVAHMPAQLQGSIVDYWIHKQNRSTLPLLLKTNACVHDCPIMMLSLQDHSYLARKLKMSSTLNPWRISTCLYYLDVHKKVQLLVCVANIISRVDLFQIIRHFGISKSIVFIIFLDIVYHEIPLSFHARGPCGPCSFLMCGPFLVGLILTCK